MDQEKAKCAFCGESKGVHRQYLHAKRRQKIGNGFNFIYYCDDCGLLETVSEHYEEDQTPYSA